jgi:hypothetical protein
MSRRLVMALAGKTSADHLQTVRDSSVQIVIHTVQWVLQTMWRQSKLGPKLAHL